MQLDIMTGPLLRQLDIMTGPLLRQLDIMSGPLLRQLNIMTGPILRQLNIMTGPILRQLNIMTGPILRQLESRLQTKTMVSEKSRLTGLFSTMDIFDGLTLSHVEHVWETFHCTETGIYYKLTKHKCNWIENRHVLIYWTQRSGLILSFHSKPE